MTDHTDQDTGLGERLWPEDAVPERPVAAPDRSGRHDGHGVPPRRSRRTTKGRRSGRRRERRRTSLLRSGAFVVLTLVVAAAVVGITALVRGGEDGQPDPAGPVAEEPDADRQPSLVFVTFDEADPAAGASLITVLAYDRDLEAGTVVLVPATTVADVPGHGLLPVGDAFAFGQGPLLDATLDNLLGVDLDHVVAVSEQGWSSLFTRLGGLTLELEERLVTRGDDGASQVRFQPGQQFLDGPRVAELMTIRAEGETDLARLPRTQLVVEHLLTVLHEDPEAVEAVFADGAPMLDTTAPVEDVRELLVQLAEAHADGSFVVRTLPVRPFGSGEQDAYRIDQERVERLVEERFSGSVPVSAATAGRRLEVRNGHGAPGIGEAVAQVLVPRGFRLVLTGNADRFDHEVTQIVVYDDSPEQLEIAEEIRELLNVGEIKVSRITQSVVDVTIVVGRDFRPPG